ncbi:MAG: MBL fold metallo-hydrolase [Planctomycetota bacterium]|nr:MAG: MBL fold metallo-hydrolase [Planctomycetota bacterium]
MICHDRGPVLATDPWLEGAAYFGSWSLSHEIPAEQRAHVAAAPYLWISHGHPDHLSLPSLEKLRDKELLLPDHFGGRVRSELAELGFRIRVLPDNQWVQLSERCRVLCFADVFQDATLLVDLGGHLIVNSNDCGDHGGGALLREITRGYASSFLCALTGWGDADMIHFFDESGRRLDPPAARRTPLGPGVHGLLSYYGIRRYAPTSTMHKYQRADSVWANAHTTPHSEFGRDFPQDGVRECLEPFIRYDLARESWTRIDPAPLPDVALPPAQFGDDWSDELDAEDVAKIRAYLAPIEHLRTFLGYIRFKVGAREHVFDVSSEHRARGITFEVPRGSLMTAIEWRIFDDLLIGNFMKTTLHGPWSERAGNALYPDFSPFLKFADNGRARSAAELARYFAHYRCAGTLGSSPAPGHDQLLAAVARYA